MKTVEYGIVNNLLAGMALQAIANRIPCFIHVENKDPENTQTFINIAIECREADLPFVERVLAPFV